MFVDDIAWWAEDAMKKSARAFAREYRAGKDNSGDWGDDASAFSAISAYGLGARPEYRITVGADGKVLEQGDHQGAGDLP